MDVSIERETIKELITFKLQHIQDLIRSILKKWVRYANPSNEEIYYVKKMKELLE